MRSLAPLSALGSTQLTELYAACNKVTAIESLAALPQLQVLELGGNRIRVLEGGAGAGRRAAGCRPPLPDPFPPARAPYVVLCVCWLTLVQARGFGP